MKGLLASLSQFWVIWIVLNVPGMGLAADLTVEAPQYSSGLKLGLNWTVPTVQSDSLLIVRSGVGPNGPWEIAKSGLQPSETEFVDKVTDDAFRSPPLEQYWYRVVGLAAGMTVKKDPDSLTQLMASSLFQLEGSGRPEASLFKHYPGIWMLLLIVLSVAAMIFYFSAQVRKGNGSKIRRIAGIDAIEEGIGRATEMGKPVLYVPGIDNLEDIQTIASILILGEVSKTVAEYQTDLIVSCCIPIVREVADEVVRSGYYRAGHPDAFDPTSVRFIASDQFAFCAGTNGIMYREKPATNIYLGRFFAESLILAETGYVNRSIQIAGTAEATQLPFFIAACDYTLIGEELFAVSAYLSQDPRLVSSLKASDVVKLVCVGFLVVGIVSHSLGLGFIGNLFSLTGGLP